MRSSRPPTLRPTGAMLEALEEIDRDLDDLVDFERRMEARYDKEEAKRKAKATEQELQPFPLPVQLSDR